MADFVRVPEADWQNILDAVRGKTGSTEKMLSGAVASEIAGIQSGGTSDSPGSASGIYMAKVTPAEDIFDLEVKHDLGTTDILFAACFVEKLNSEANSSMQNMAICRLWAKTEIPVRMTSTTQSPNYEVYYPFNYNNGEYKSGSGAFPNTEDLKSKILDENTFQFTRVGKYQKFHTGFTYTVIVMAASAFTDMGV